MESPKTKAFATINEELVRRATSIIETAVRRVITHSNTEVRLVVFYSPETHYEDLIGDNPPAEVITYRAALIDPLADNLELQVRTVVIRPELRDVTAESAVHKLIRAVADQMYRKKNSPE